MGSDWRRSRVDCDSEGFECGTCGSAIWCFVFAFVGKGTTSGASGVYGDEDPDEDDSALDGSRVGNDMRSELGCWCECVCVRR